MVCVMEYNLLPWTCIHPSFYIDIHLTTHPINGLRSPMHVHSLGGLYTSLCIMMLKRGNSWNLFSSEAIWLFVLYGRIFSNQICVRKYSCPQTFYDPYTQCTFPHRMNLMWNKNSIYKNTEMYISQLRWIWVTNESRMMVSHSLFITREHLGFSSQWHHQVEVCLSRLVGESVYKCVVGDSPLSCIFCFIHQLKNTKTPKWGEIL